VAQLTNKSEWEYCWVVYLWFYLIPAKWSHRVGGSGRRYGYGHGGGVFSKVGRWMQKLHGGGNGGWRRRTGGSGRSHRSTLQRT